MTRLVALTLLALSFAGCGLATRAYVDRAAHDAARSAVQGAAEALPNLTEPLRQTLRETLLDETLPKVSQRMTDSTLQSVRANLLGSPEVKALVDEVVARTMTALAREGSQTTRQLVRATEPELSEAVRRALSTAVATLRDGIERDISPRTRDLARANAEVLVATLTAGLEVQLAHLRQTARDIGRDLIAEAAASMRERKDVVGEVTHVAMQQAVKGAQAAMWESLPDRVPPGLVAGTLIMAILLVASAATLVVYWWRYQQSAKSLTIIAQRINDSEAIELKHAIQRSAQENYVGKWLSNFLTKRGL
jgi:hypothetical protein